MSDTGKGRTLEERAAAVIEKLTAAGTYNENDYPEEDVAVIQHEFADVIESDPRVRELVSAAQKAHNILLDRGLGAFTGLGNALKPFEK